MTQGSKLGRLVREGTQAARVAAPGVAAAALGSLALASPADAAAPVPNVETGGATPGTATALPPGTSEFSIPAFDASQFFSFAIPESQVQNGIMIGLSGNDPNLDARLVISSGDELNKRLIVPFVTLAPGGGASTVMAGGGPATIIGGGGGASTISGGGGSPTLTGGSFTLSAGSVFSFADLQLSQLGGNFTAQGGGASTVFAGSNPATIGAGGGSATIFSGGGRVTIGSVGNTATIQGGGSATIGTSQTLIGVGDAHTILGGFAFNGDPPADDVIFGIELDHGADINGGIVLFNDAVDPPTPVSEPATLGLLGTALAGLFSLRRRRA
jgi:hypothetical protein